MLHPDNARILLRDMNLAAVARAAGLTPRLMASFMQGKDMYAENYVKLVAYFEHRYGEDVEQMGAVSELLNLEVDEEDDLADSIGYAKLGKLN